MKEKAEEIEGVKEIKGSEEIAEEERREWEKRNRLVDGLKRCPVCKGRPIGVIYGRQKRGVWVGCERTRECMRNIVIHDEGWSFEEVCREWNRLNRWPLSWLRWLKMKYERLNGRAAKWDRERRRAKERERAENERERKRIFYGEEGKEEKKAFSKISEKIKITRMRRKGA